MTPTERQIELEQRYVKLCTTPSNINEHLPILRALASDCDTVWEFGTGRCRSTVALALGVWGGLISLDIVRPKELDPLLQEWVLFRQQSTLEWEPDKDEGLQHNWIECDLLFIDDEHTYDQVTAELRKFGNRAQKYIAFHDTESYPDVKGAAMLWMRDQPHWEVMMDLKNNNGLLVLRRKDD